MEIIVYTPPEKQSPEELEIVNQLFAAGLKRLHLRKPNFSSSEMERYISLIDKKFHGRIMLHSHHNLARKFDVRGIHYPEKMRHNPLKNWVSHRWFKVFYPKKETSAAFHSIKAIEKNRTKYSYLTLSPVFETISKQNTQPAASRRSIYEFAKRSKLKLVALGGVDETKIEAAKELGFWGIAVLGALWSAPDPVAYYTQLQQLCQPERMRL